MANVTVTTAATFLPEIWSDDILRIVEANLTLANRVHRYDSDAKTGTKINVPSLTEITASSKSASTDVTSTANTESEIEISLNIHKYASVKIEDIAAVQAKADLMKEYTEAIGYAVSKAIDTSVAALYAGLSQTQGAAATAITDAVILSSIQNLDDANAPLTNRHFVIKPAAKKNILSLDKFVLFQNTGSVNGTSRVLNGNLGEIYGVEVAVSTNIQTSGTPTQNNNLMFHRDCFGLAMQKDLRVQSQYKLESLAWLLVADAIYGTAEMRDTFGVNVIS